MWFRLYKPVEIRLLKMRFLAFAAYFDKQRTARCYHRLLRAVELSNPPSGPVSKKSIVILSTKPQFFFRGVNETNTFVAWTKVNEPRPASPIYPKGGTKRSTNRARSSKISIFLSHISGIIKLAKHCRYLLVFAQRDLRRHKSETLSSTAQYEECQMENCLDR